MAIGFLAFGFAAFCGLACLLSAGRADPANKKAADYETIYQAIMPKEF